MPGVKYTREVLATEVAARTGILYEDAAKVLVMAVEVMAEVLAGGGQVALRELGTLYAETRTPRKGYNPKTRATCTISERRRYKFRAGPSLLTRGEVLRKSQQEES